MSVQHIRAQFPILSRSVYGKPLVYLDSAASAQRPQAVVDVMEKLALEENANLHRSVHCLSSEATEAYENTRDAVRRFLNAPSRGEIIFTSGTTAGINLVAYSFGQAFVGEGDEVLVSVDNHHSNLVPWQQLCFRKKARLVCVDIQADGTLDLASLEKQISARTKIVAISHISNVLGIVNPVQEAIRICHAKGVPVLLDGAQGVVHAAVDVQALDCDFYAFSGHKLYAATGTGVLYGKRQYLEAMPPFLTGGEMVGTVTLEKTSFAPLPLKFEAGTQNFNAIPTLVPAMELCRAMREDGQVQEEQQAIQDYIYKELAEDKRITLYGTALSAKIPLFSFAVKGAHHEDLALILDKMGIAVRSGQMCAEPLMQRLGVTGLLRASFAPYNTLEEAKYFVECLHKAINMLV